MKGETPMNELSEKELDQAAGGYGYGYAYYPYNYGYTTSNTTYYKVGQMIDCGGYVPGGFILCDGRVLSTTDYSELYKAIGQSYGTSGPGTFCVPNEYGKAICYVSGVAAF